MQLSLIDLIDATPDPEPAIPAAVLRSDILQALVRGRMFGAAIGDYLRSAHGYKLPPGQVPALIAEMTAEGVIVKSESLPTTYSLPEGPQEHVKRGKAKPKPKPKAEQADLDPVTTEQPKARACRSGKKGKVHLVEFNSDKAVCSFSPSGSSRWRETDALIECGKCLKAKGGCSVVGYFDCLEEPDELSLLPIPCEVCQAMGAEPSEAGFSHGVVWICKARGGLHVCVQRPGKEPSWAGWGTGLLEGYRWDTVRGCWVLPDGTTRDRSTQGERA
jgi:hypothetical protein